MMMGGDKGKIAALIVAGMKPKDKYESGKTANAEAFDAAAGEPDKQVGEGLLSAAEEVISAVGMKDAQALALALKNFFEMADSDEPPSEEEKSE